MHRETPAPIVRAARATDRRAVAELWTRALGEPVSEETLASWEAREIADERRLRVVAEHASTIVGVAAVVRRTDERHAHAVLFVDERARQRGVGTALLNEIVPFAQAADSSSIRATTTPSSLDFARRRGFEAVSESIDSILDVARWRDTDTVDEPKRIVIEPVHPFDDAVFHRVSSELAESLGGWLDRADFDNRILRNGADRELQFVAKSGAEVVGVLCTERVPGTDRAHHCLTAVRPEFRGRGVARALKAHAIRAAKQAGIGALVATNDANNAAMLAVNAASGFARWRTRVDVVLRLA